MSFDQDVIISQMNEYEVLQLLMGDCRERLAAYGPTLEEMAKSLQVRRWGGCVARGGERAAAVQAAGTRQGGAGQKGCGSPAWVQGCSRLGCLLSRPAWCRARS